MTKRKLTASILIIVMLSGIFLTGFTYQQGIGNIHLETESKIFEKTTFHKQIAGQGTQGIKNAYFVNTDIRNTDLKPYVFEGEVTGMYTMDSMISSLEAEGYKVVAGINGDLFDMSSGTPKGLTIHNGIIKTSGYAPKHVISFNNEGIASLEEVNLKYKLKGMINEGTEYNAEIGFFNVPHGAAKALHLYNRQYAPSTKTKSTSVEVILNAGSVDNAQLKIGKTITASVVEVINGNFNTPIGEGQLVLSTVGDSAYAVQLAQLIPGSEVELSVEDSKESNLLQSQEALGVNNIVYHDNKFISQGTSLNPRTAIGIKADGSLLLYVVDGRQTWVSTGLGLTDTGKHLVDLGCSTIVTLDGGGSASISVREAGIDSKAIVKNSPSTSQRKLTNALFLVYDTKGNSSAEHLHTYPSNSLAMPGAEIEFKTYTSNNKYERLPLTERVEYRLDSSYDSTIDENGLFTAGNNLGTTVIEVKSGNLSTKGQVEIQNKITFTSNVNTLDLNPGESFDVDVVAKSGYAPIASKDSLFTWTCDPTIGTIDENGLFQSKDELGLSGNIYIEYNNLSHIIPVQVGAGSIDFEDTKTHWARKDIGKLAGKGFVNGMGDGYYKPDDFLTRAQFLTMLANIVPDLDVTLAEPAAFTDVPESEWFYNVVNWGFTTGIVSGLDDTTFAPNQKITREQMASMLDKFTKTTNVNLPEKNEEVIFTDNKLISPWAVESVNKIVLAGLMNGYPEGNYKPQGNATRAEGASVIYRLITKES